MPSHVYCINLVSRNKDNVDVPNFKPRTRVFLLRYEGYDSWKAKLTHALDVFTEEGVPGEASRCYYSINPRDMEKTKENLLCKMIKDKNFDLTKLEAAAVSCAMQPECAETHSWLFDFDDDSYEDLQQFVAEVKETAKDGVEITTHKTPHGYAVVVDHGFDTRELMDDWGDCCELKRDSFLFVGIKTKAK